jgi:outer membrane protein OmpA-like peptidoglycan-associated protein
MKQLVLATALCAVMTTGCATKEYVHEYVQGQVGPVKGDVKSVNGRVDQTATDLKNLAASQAATNNELKTALASQDGRISKNSSDIAQLSKSAQEALDRASAAGKLASGKLVYEVALSDDTLKFKPDSAALSKEAMAALDAFAAKLKGDNKNVFIEIQGHTDSRGDAAVNMRLGETRAEAVRRYLNMKGGIPLHRMSAISYGESMPVAKNLNRDGRSQNRRVVLVVLQ